MVKSINNTPWPKLLTILSIIGPLIGAGVYVGSFQANSVNVEKQIYTLIEKEALATIQLNQHETRLSVMRAEFNSIKSTAMATEQELKKLNSKITELLIHFRIQDPIPGSK